MKMISILSSIILLMICFKSTKSERWDGNTLYDLEGQGATFLAQANLWTAVSLKNAAARVTTCNGNDILGGYNILAAGKGKYWERNWTNLPSHNQISFYMDFYPVDSWDKAGRDHFQMKFDSNITEGWILDVYGNAVWNHPICGNTGWNDVDNIKTYVILPHNSSTLNFRIISQLDEDTPNESFGFRNISFTFETVTTPTNNFCGSTVFPLANNWCPCASTKQYMSPAQSGTCYDCNSACKTCTGPNSNQCASCDDGFYLSSGSCLPCDSTCATCNGGTYNKCLTCHAGDYLVSNNTCVSVCPTPFYDTTNAVIDFCDTHCPGKYAFKNGACGTSCPYPLQPYILATLKACVCDSSTPDDDSCMSCDISCSSCNGNTAVDCLSCFDGFYLDNGPSSQNGTCEACESTCATCYGGGANQCNSCFSDAFLVLDGSVNNGTCGNCDSSCLTCDGSTNTTCLSCPDGFYLDPNPSPAVDGACLPCNSTCATCTGPDYDECVTCYSGDFLVTNNTCISECNMPFFSTSDGTNDFCDTPCLGQYAFIDQNCTSSCTSLYQPEETAVVLKACICHDFSYSNGSCLASCNSPMTTREENGTKYCDFNCPSGEFLNYDGTCSTDCGLPSIPRVDGDKLFCDYGGCDSVDIVHLKFTSTGHYYSVVFSPITCDPEGMLVQNILNANEDFKRLLSDPYFEVDKKIKKYYVNLILSASVLQDMYINMQLLGLAGTLPVPKKLIGSELAQNLTSIAQTASKAMGFFTASNIFASLSLQNTASAWGFVGFQQFITFFKYANIDYPLQLEFFFLLGGATDFAGAPNYLDKATESEYTHVEDNDDVQEEQTPPAKFYYYDATSFFIKNGGATFLVNWAALAIVFIVIFIKRIPLLHKSKVYKIIEIVDDKLRWNFVLRSFLSVGLPQAISIFLQLRVLSNQETYLTLSAALTMVALVHYIGMCAFIFYILHKQSFTDMKKKDVEKRYSTLFEGIELKSNHSKYYHVHILARGTTLALMVVFAQKLNLLQVIIMIAFNTGLVYFLFKVEFEERRETIKTRITETLIIPMEISFALLTRNSEPENYYIILGWVAFGFIGVMFVNEIIFALKSQYNGIKSTIITLIEKYKTWRKKRAEKMNAKIQKPQEQADFLSAEPKSGIMSPSTSSSPTGRNNLLHQSRSLRDFNSSGTRAYLKGINFAGTAKIHPAPSIAQHDFSENEAFSAEGTPVSLGVHIGSSREMNSLWPRANRQHVGRRRQIVPETTIKSIEEEGLLLK